MDKPKHGAAYSEFHALLCERTLVTLLRGLGPWKHAVYVVGGLVPRYLFPNIDRSIPGEMHKGTMDVDVLLDLELLANIDAYRSLADNLKAMGFSRGTNEDRRPRHHSWRMRMSDGVTIVLDLLCDAPKVASGGSVLPLPNERGLSAVQIPGARLVMRDYFEKTLEAELLGDRGLATETVRVANLVPFIVLKSFAYDERVEEKDAYDLIFSLKNHGPERAAAEFSQGLKTWGGDASFLRKARSIIEHRFYGDGVTSFKLDGPTSYARFLRELGNDDKYARDRQLAAAVCAAFLKGLPALTPAMPIYEARQSLFTEPGSYLATAREALASHCGVVISSRPLERVEIPLVGLEGVARDAYSDYLAKRGGLNYFIGHFDEKVRRSRTRDYVECSVVDGDWTNYWSLTRNGELVVAVSRLAEGVDMGVTRQDLRLDNLVEAVLAFACYLEGLYGQILRATGCQLSGCQVAVSVENAVGLVPATHHGRLLTNLGVKIEPSCLPIKREEVWHQPVRDSRGLLQSMVEELVYLCVGSGAFGDGFLAKFGVRMDELYGRLPGNQP